MHTRQVPIIEGMKVGDESGLIISWLLRVGLFLLVLGVVLFDVGSIIVNKVTLSSSAEDVAVAVSLSVSERNTGGQIFADSIIYDMAVDVVEDEANGVKDARVLRKGTEMDEQGVVHVRLRRRVDTLVTDLISPLKKYTITTGNGQAGTN